MSCSSATRGPVNSLGAAAFPTSPDPTPVDISCHPKVSNLGHSAGPSTVQQAAPGGSILAGKTSPPELRSSCPDLFPLKLYGRAVPWGEG